MNGSSKKGLLGMAAAVALTAGLYSVADGFAQGMMGGQPGWNTNQTTMMGGQQGTTGYQGMGPGMMGGQPGATGTTGYQGMGPGMMGGQPGATGATGYQGMGPGMMGGQAGTVGNQGWGPGMMGGHMGFAKLTTDPVAVDSYLSDIETRLGITAKQETAWNAYAQAVRKQITTQTDAHNTMHATVARTPQEWNERRLAAMETMIGENRRTFEAFRALHARLDARQRTVADQLSWSCHG